ncbi:hypothetical protein HUU53_03965, partial [Candidatus Micrarchaeota archaeon]|nr:hypothetical protein [Candidatus Micrarchaeota archaeon]
MMRLRNLVLGLSFLVFLSAFSNAADLTAPYVNSSNTTTAGLTANITINFTLPSTANYSNISIEFPSSFDVSNARIQNVTAITDATVLAGDYNGQVNGQNVSFIIQNLANITGAISLNVSRVVLPSLATSYSFTIYAVENTSVMNDGPTSTLNSLTVTAANIVNVTTYVANVSPNYSLSTPVGSVFFIAAFGQDSFGNVNITQGFNFLNNNSAADSAGNILSSGNGTSYMIFNA